ncbi:MAG: fumarylacetoacetate hydrolase family protein [Pseudomonadota bacterium]
MANEEIGEALAAARRDRSRRVDLGPDRLDETEAYRVQDHAASAYESPMIGYKIGATSPEAQKIIGCDAPFFGPMLETDRFETGARLAADDTMLGLECEIAFQMARDLAPADGVPDRAGLMEAIACCAPALEVVGRRTLGDGFPNAAQCIADFGANALFCAGSAIVDWQTRDLATLPVAAAIDGTQTNAGTPAAVLGHPLDALAWLVGALHEKGKPLQAGHWISTGTCLGVVPVKPGTEVLATFGEVGELVVAFD